MRLFEHPDFDQLILQAAERFQLRPAIIEKDYYVTEVLRIPYLLNLADPPCIPSITPAPQEHLVKAIVRFCRAEYDKSLSRLWG